MPVITRSQVKAAIGSSSKLLKASSSLNSIGSSSGLLVSDTTFPSIGSPDELLIPSIVAIGSTDELLQPIIDSFPSNFTPDTDLSGSQDRHLSLAQQATLGISNLKISNIDNFEISNVPSVYTSSNSLHNFCIYENIKMEGDCDDKLAITDTTTEMSEMSKFLASLTVQMTWHMESLQEQLLLHDNKISQTQENFKQEVRDEIDQLRQLLLSTNSLGNPQVQSVAINTVPSTSSTVSSRNNQVSSTTPILDTSTPSVTPNAGISSNDVQSHMMLMLTESFTKLSTVLDEKTQDHKTEVKSEWPKFAGDVKKLK